MPQVATPPVALYIHIPFCVSLCPYCDFVVFAGAAARGPRARIEAFIAALLVELDLRADALDAAFPDGRPPLETVYLGGGTPSMLRAEALTAILERVRRRFGIGDGSEITLEANPGPDARGDMNLSATDARRMVCVAAKTQPIAPSPSLRSMRYLPSMVSPISGYTSCS
jgi:coproporphyrinogen III oxidase-like Fe-S oxidoreductase